MNKFSKLSANVWADANFCRFIIINSLESLAIGIIIAVFPLLISEKFGSKDELIAADALLILPRVVFAPFVGSFLLKKGPVQIVRMSMVGLAGVFAAMPLIAHYWVFQGTIVLRAIVGMACASSLMTLQAWVIPKGKNMAANSVYLATSRTLFFSAPFLVKLGERYCATADYFYIASNLFLVGAGLTLGLSLSAHTGNSPDSKDEGETVNASYGALWRLFRKKNILFSLFVPLFAFFLISGALNLFLLWTVLHTFHYPEASYTSLLTARGVGNVLSSFLAPFFVGKMTQKVNVSTFYFIMRLISIICLLGLGFLSNFYGVMALLALATLPQAMVSICFYTLLQKHLTKRKQGIVHTLTFPISLLFALFGSLLGLTHTHSYLSLEHFWLLTGVISLSVALLPLLSNQKGVW